MTSSHRVGFTIVELLVVIAIIAVLSGMLLGGLSVLRQAAHKNDTLTLLRSLQTAMRSYQEDWGRFGDTQFADFAANPVFYLVQRNKAAGPAGQPYLDLPKKFLGDATGAGADPANAVVILDGWGQPLLFTNGAAGVVTTDPVLPLNRAVMPPAEVQVGTAVPKQNNQAEPGQPALASLTTDRRFFSYYIRIRSLGRASAIDPGKGGRHSLVLLYDIAAPTSSDPLDPGARRRIEWEIEKPEDTLPAGNL